MSLFSKLKSIPAPPLRNIINVAIQTGKQHIPTRKEYEKPGQREEGTNRNLSYTHAVATSDGEMDFRNISDETTELNPFRNHTLYEKDVHNVQATSFTVNDYEGTYQQNDKHSYASVSSEGSSRIGEGEDGDGTKIDEFQAAWNITNAIQGMFIVSLPFAVLHGGYWAIFAMIGIAYICCYTGKVLVQCLYEPDSVTGEIIRVRDSYVSIAKVCFGPKLGARAVSAAQLIELLMTCILYVVVCGDLLSGTYPQGAYDSRAWMMVVGIFLIPMGFLKSIKMVSTLSFWCTMSHIVINVVILGYCILQIGDWGWSKVRWSIDMENFPISLGVIVFSYTSQIFLPSLEGSMIDRTKFDWMLDWSHITAAIFKAGFGYLCFLTFQNDTQQVITNNFHSQNFKGFVNIFLVIKAILSYPLPFYAACELLERNLFRGPPKTPFPNMWHKDGDLKIWGLGFRLGIIVSTILMAIFIPHFSILMGFIGSFTGTMLSFIWPCYFHIKIKGHLLNQMDLAKDYIIIGLGFLFGIVGIYDSGYALINAFEIGLPF